MMREWRNANKFRLQVSAFLAGVIAPFVMYVGIMDKFAALAIGAFVVIVIGMIVVVWAG